MDISGHTILITGGASGIGYAFARRFLAAKNTVVICGRREDKLLEAKSEHPDFHVRVADVADPEQRERLTRWAFEAFPQLDVLVNNAGIQQRIDLTSSPDWSTLHREIVTNLE